MTLSGRSYNLNMQEINVIQFLPYSPPHKWWLETHSQEWAEWWIKKNYGSVTHITSDIGQNIEKEEHLLFASSWDAIGYKKDGITVYLVPSIELIPNFPIPKFWKKNFWKILKTIRTLNPDIVVTRTRFFPSSLFGGIWAMWKKISWIHIEHGSDYVLLEGKVKSSIAYIYDKTIGKCIFSLADRVISISEGVKEFLIREFHYQKDTPVIYRGIEFTPGERQKKDNTITIGFVGRLVKLKWVDLLIEAFGAIHKQYPDTRLELVWNGEMREALIEKVKKLGLTEAVSFLGEIPREKVGSEFLSHIDIAVNPSYQEWLPTSIIEWLLSGCVMVATDVWGTREISDEKDLILVEKWNVKSISAGLAEAITQLDTYRGLSGKSGKLGRFDWDKNIVAYFEFFRKVLDENKKN